MLDVLGGMLDIKKTKAGTETAYAIAKWIILDDSCSLFSYLLLQPTPSFWMCITREPIPRPKNATEMAMNA